jgi:hypothetical protein
MANTDPTSLSPTADSGSATGAFPPLAEQQTRPPQPAPLAEAPTLPPPVGGAGPAEVGDQEVKGYEILGELGRGGMGVVYKARQVGLNRVVALKMILAGSHTEPAVLARFQAEALAIAKLQHPNIVQIYETGQQDGLPYLSLEYVDGGNLDRRLAGQPRPPREAAELTKTLARAVHAAHRAGVIHRDLKPANVLLTSGGVPKITDFGLAKTLGDDRGQTASGAILGTPSYMAPEQAGGRRREITPAVDVYALGAILYELLTGRPPFRAETPLDTLLLVVSEEVTPPSEFCQTVPRDLEAICLKCLEKNPASRYADAAALADDLERCLKGEPVSARSETIVEQAWRRLRKRPLIATAITLTAVLALFSALALTYLEPSSLLVCGWVLWIASATAVYLLLPDYRGLVLAGFGFLLLAHVGWQSTMPPRTPGRYPAQLGMAWIICATVLFFLLPRRPGGLALAGFCSLVLGLAFIGIKRLGPDVEFVLHPVGVAACCIVARWIARATGGDSSTAVYSGIPIGMLANWTCLNWLYPATKNVSQNVSHGIPISKIEAALFGSAIVSVLASACGAFLFTDPRIRQCLLNTIRGVVHPFAAIRLRVWLGIAAAPVAGCLLFVVGRGVWLWATNPELLTLKGDKGGENRFFSVVFSPDGKRLAATAARITGGQPLVTVWDSAGGQKLDTIPLNDAAVAYCTVFSPNGEWLAVATDNREEPVKLFSAATGQDAIVFKGHTGAVRSLAFSSNGKRLLTGSEDGTARIWDSATGKELLALPRQVSRINGVAFNPDSTQLATCTIAGTVKLWDAATGQQLSTLTTGEYKGGAMNNLHNVTFSPDGSLLAAATVNTTVPGASTVRVWEAGTGKAVLNLLGGYVAFSPNGTRLATATAYGFKLYDVATGQEVLELRGHTSIVYCVAFRPDGKRLASTSLDQTIRVWKIAD